MSTDFYDVAIVGSGFASSFFLQRLLAKRPRIRVAVFERGQRDSHEWQIEQRKKNGLSEQLIMSSVMPNDTFLDRTPEKPWHFTPAFGGSSKCWWAATPRLLPSDFHTREQYAVGSNWPITYADLEPRYCEVEETMQVSGSPAIEVWPRSRPYPQPPHKLSVVDRALAAAFPGLIGPAPCARARVATKNRRQCCASAVCHQCPVDAKFTIENELGHLYSDPRVTLMFSHQVLRLVTAGGVVRSAVVLAEGREKEVRAESFILGANAIFNPHILLNSGLEHPMLGKNLVEQVSQAVIVSLRGLDNVGGSTSITANGFMFYDGEHRREHAACMVASVLPSPLRFEPGKYRQAAYFNFIYEDVPDEKNAVTLSEDPSKPRVAFGGRSAYAKRGLDQTRALAEKLVATLPVEKIELRDKITATEAHILGTVRMGNDPKTSVVNRHLVHHRYRNLLVLGGSAFPTAPPANPTLTISALSLWAADAYL